MSKKLILACLLTAIFSLSFTSLSAQFLSWDYINILDDLKGGGGNPAMTKALDGTLHMCFWNQEEDRLIYAQKLIGSNTFTFEYVDSVNANGFLSSIELDNQQRPHIAFYENIFGVCHLRYAYRTAPNTWVVEQVPSKNGEGFGIYNNYQQKHTLNLAMENGNDPQIVAFNATSGETNNCFQDDNEWQSYQSYKNSFGNWRTRRLGYLTGILASCQGDTLPDGDRYGEYSTSFIDSSGRHNVVLMGKTQLKTFRFTTNGNDSTWTQSVIDSIYNQHFDELITNASTWFWIPNFLNPEGFSSVVTPNGNVHLGYTTSLNWGDNFIPEVKLFNLVLHTKIEPNDSATYNDFDSVHTESQHYRSHTRMAFKGNDTLFMSYVDRDTGMIILATSYDQGDHWVHDTVVSTNSAAFSPIEVVNDTVNVLVYISEIDRLILAQKSINSPGDPWKFLPVTASQNRGASLDAAIVRGTTDTVFIAYNDAFDDFLFFTDGNGTGTNWSWNHERIDSSNSNFGAVSYARAGNSDHYVLYRGGAQGDLTLARKSGGQWTYEVVDTANGTSFTDLVITSSDTIHVVWFGGTTLCLNYARRHIADSVWIRESVDCSNNPVGEYPVLLVDDDELPHVVYYDAANFTVKYAVKSSISRSWNVEFVDSFGVSISGQHNSMAFDGNGDPAIVYLDQGNSQLKFAERNLGGSWDITILESGGTTSLGRPSDLVFDQFGNPWVAYNYFSSFDRVRLQHRDTTWRQVGVGTQGRIANAFDLEVVDGDLFLIGKKTEPNNSGLAMLYAENGVFVMVEEAKPTLPELSAYPNPFHDELHFDLSLSEPGIVSLGLYNLYGQQVLPVISKERLSPGTYQYHLNTSALPSGIYFYELAAEGGRSTRKLIRLK